MERIPINLRPVFKDQNNPNFPTMISIITAKHCARINIDDIEMIEQEGRLLHVITADADYTVYDRIDSLAAYLNDNSFYRALNCMIINFEQVHRMDNSYIYFESGRTATMGRNAYSRTRAAYRRYLEEYPQYCVPDRRFRVAEKH